jgi:polyphosphate glucokinase
MEILGIDIGGTGIKGAIVDIRKGEFVSERYRIETPQPATPDAVSDTVAEIGKHFNWNGAIGCTFPAIMKHGVAHSAANVDKTFLGTDVQRMIQRKTGDPVRVINDADAAGIAEVRFGAGRGRTDLVIMLTIGTGIGSAMFINGNLVPNSELGHLQIRGKIAEHRASDRIRREKELSFENWSKRLNEYLNHVEFLFSPDLLIIGGGISRKYEKFFKYLHVQAEIVPAQLRNDAGIIGAAIAAQDLI